MWKDIMNSFAIVETKMKKLSVLPCETFTLIVVRRRFAITIKLVNISSERDQLFTWPSRCLVPSALRWLTGTLLSSTVRAVGQYVIDEIQTKLMQTACIDLQKTCVMRTATAFLPTTSTAWYNVGAPPVTPANYPS